MDFATGLSYAKDIGSLLSSAKSLFGGGDDDKPEWKSMRDQVNWSIASAKAMPSAQVEGLRSAGLNPMLAVGKGISAPPPVTSSPGAETNAATARELSRATIANQTAQAVLYGAQARNVEADTQDKLLKPEQTSAQTALLKAQTATEAWGPENRKWATELISAQYGKTVAEKDALLQWQRKLVEAQQINYEATTRLINQQVRQATTKADLDAAYSELERIIAMGAEGVGAVTGAVANSARAIASGKPKTIINKAPNVILKR